MSYDETAELPVGSQVVQHDGQEPQDGGPGRGRLPSFSIATRVSRGRSRGAVIDCQEMIFPLESRSVIVNRPETRRGGKAQQQR
eukprot:767776-Pyramimonas_sp.AAC.1